MDADTRGAGHTSRALHRSTRQRWDDATVAVAARTGVSPRAVAGLAVVVILVLAVLGVRTAWTRSQAKPEPIAGVPALVAAPSTAPASVPVAGRVTPAGAPVSASVLMVHVVGQVQRPGVVRLSAGARVQDAVEAAGGASRGADLSAVNLARLVVDGEQIVVPKPGQAVPAPAGTGASGATGAAGSSTSVINLNIASLSDLDSLPGVGPVLAQRILDWRAQNGRFTSVDELGEVSGIGDAVLERIRPRVRV